MFSRYFLLALIGKKVEIMKDPDKRCCGQIWDGEKMSTPSLNLQVKDKNEETRPDKPKSE